MASVSGFSSDYFVTFLTAFGFRTVMYDTTSVRPFPAELAKEFVDPVFVASGSTSMVFTAKLAIPSYREHRLPKDDTRFAVKIPFIGQERGGQVGKIYSLNEFYNEIGALENVQPHIAKYHSFRINPRLCIVMEYVRGRPLSRCAPELGAYGLMRVLKDLAHAVTELHSNNYVCGQISLDDIIVRRVKKVSSDSGVNKQVSRVYRAKLVDLGGAQSLHSDDITHKQRQALRTADLIMLMFAYSQIVSLSAKPK